MIIGLKSLDRMLENNDNITSFSYMGKCFNCDEEVDVKITRTSGGYGLDGGVLYEPDPGKIKILCSACYEYLGALKSLPKGSLIDAA